MAFDTNQEEYQKSMLSDLGGTGQTWWNWLWTGCYELILVQLDFEGNDMK
jgi:hypothetical protein